MKIDVTNTQTGNDPEVHQISKDVDRFDENIKLPTDPPVKSSGPAAVAGKSVGDAVAEAAAETKADLGSEIETAESVVKGQEDVYQKPTESIKTANQDYWNKIYNHISGLNGFDKSIGVQDFIDRAQGDDEYIEGLRKKLIRSTYKKPVDFTLGKSLDEFKNNLYSQEGVLDYSKVATGVLKQEFKPSVSKSKLEGQNTFASLAAPSAPATTSGNIEFDRVKSIKEGTVPKIETQEVKEAYSTISSAQNPFYDGDEGLGEQSSTEWNNAQKILTTEMVSPTKFGAKTYTENHDPLVAFGLTKNVLYKKTKAQDDLMLQTEDSEIMVDELNTIINNKAWGSTESMRSFLKHEHGVEINPDRTDEFIMALNSETGDFYNPKEGEIKEGYEEVMMTGNEIKLRRVLKKENEKLNSARGQMSNLAFGGSVKSEGGEIGKEKYWELKLSMKEDINNVPGLGLKLNEYEEMYKDSKGGSSETTENWKKKFLNYMSDSDWDEDGGDIRVSEEDKEKYNNYLNLIENKVDRDIKIDESREKLKKDPNYLKTFDGYYAYVNKLTEDMGEALVPWQKDYNENAFTTVKKNVETFNKGLYEQKKVEFDRVNESISAKYQSQYDKVSDTDSEAIAITEKYKALYAEAITDEAKAEVHSAYNEELMTVPMMTAIAKQHKQAIDLVQNSLEDKYSKASRDHFGSVMKTQTEAYQRDASKYVQERFIKPINEDLGVKGFIHNEMEVNPDFNNLSFADKKAAINVLWGKWKKIVINESSSGIKTIPLNREEAKLPAYQWTGKTEKNEDYDISGGEYGSKGSSIKERLGDEGRREFLFHAMSSTMFEGTSQKPSVFQVKSWAESMEKEVDLEVKRLEKQTQSIVKTSLNGTGVDTEKPFDEDGAPNPDYKNAYSEVRPSDKKKKDLIKLQETIAEIINHPEQDEDWFSELYYGFTGGDFEEYVPFLATLVDIDKNLSLYNISEKMQNDKPLSFQERVLMDSYSGLKKINDLRPRSWIYKLGENVAHMVPYVGEFALTMGAFTTTKAATKKALTASFKKSIDKTVKKQILLANTGRGLAAGWEGMGREAVTLMGEKMIDGVSYSVAALAQATANSQMTVNHLIERMTPESQFMLSGNGEEIYTQINGKGEDFGEAFFKAYGMTYAEIFSEQLGMHLMKLPKGAMKELVPGGAPEWLKRTMIGGWMRSRKFTNVGDATKYIIKNRLGWSGFMGEYMEEFVNGRMSALITGDRGVFDIDGDEELMTLMTVMLGGTMMSVGSLTTSAVRTVAGATSVELKADVMDNSGNSSIVSEVFPSAVWKDFNKFLGKPGVHPTQLDDILGTYEDLTKKQRDVLGAIYVKAKGKELVDNENYETIKADLEKTTGREINDQWLRGGFEMPTIEEGAKGEVVESEEGLRENFLTSLSSRNVTEPLDEDVTIEELKAEATKENDKEEVTPEEEVVETPVEGEQQVTEGVAEPDKDFQEIVDISDKENVNMEEAAKIFQTRKDEERAAAEAIATEEEVPFPEEEKKAPVEKPKTKKKLQIAEPYVKGEGRNQKLVIEDAMKPNPTRRGKYQKLSAYEKAIEKGEMTYEEAKAAIESIGLEVPENISRLDPTKETETKETKTEKETKEEPIGYEEMVEVEPGKFVPKSTLPTEEAPAETKETETKPTVKGEIIEVKKKDKAPIMAWVKAKPGQDRAIITRAKQTAVKNTFGIVSPEVRTRVANMLGLKPGNKTVKGLEALLGEHVKDNDTFNEFVEAVGLAKAEEKAAVAEAKAIKEKEAPAKNKKAQEELFQKKKDFDAKMQEGEAQRKKGNYKEAKQLYNEAIEIDPKRTLEAQEQINIVSNNTLDTSLDTSKEKNTKETEKEKKAKAEGQKIRTHAANLGIDYATDERVSLIKKKVEEKVGKKYGEEGFEDALKVARKKAGDERTAQKDFNNSVKNGVLPIKETDMGKEALEQAITMQQNKVDKGGKPSDVKINGRGPEHSISAQINQAFKDKKITAAQQKALLKKAKAVTDNYKEKQAEQKRLEEEGDSLIERKVSEQRRVGGIIDSMLGPIVEKLQKVFPKIKVYATEEDYKKGTKEARWSKKRADNNIAFFDRESFKIYLNPKKATADTAMEEFAHLWTTIAKLKAGGIYGTGISLVEGSVYVDMALEEQPDLAHKDKDGNIVVSEELLHEALGKAIKDGGAKLGAKKNKFREAVRKIFRYIGRLLGVSPSINIANTTLEEFTAIAQGELLAGKKITNASSETLSKGMDFKISNSILAKRGFWGKRKSWWNAWAKERQGINKELYDKFGKSEGLVKSWQRESQDVWNEFQSELNNYLTASFPTGFLKKGFKGKVKEYINSKKYKEAKENIKKRKKIWNAVGNALNTHEGIEEVPEELKESVRALKTHISDLGDKIISLYRKLDMDITGLEASFDKKRGIYIHRTYEKHAVADWHKKYEDRFTEEEIIAAKNEIHKIYESNNVKSVEWKRTTGNEIELYFTSTKGVVGKSSVGGPIGESIKVKQKNLRGFLNEMFTEKVADKLTEDINRSFAPTEGFNTWTFPKPVKSSHPQVNFRKTDGEVINILEDLLDRDNAEASVDLSRKMGNTVRKGDKDILRKRKDIPKALRVIYGEYTDPYINFTKTTQRINSLLAKTELEAELLRQGEGSLFTKNKDKVTNNIEIKEGKSSLLGGMYTTPEMHALLFDKDGGLMSMFTPNFIAEGKSKTVNNAAVPVLYKMLNAQTKASLTVMNPSGQSRNMLSAILFLTQNGHLPIHLLEATRIIKSDMNAAELITGSIMNPYLGALSVITWGQDIAYGKLGNSMGWKQPEKQTKEAIKKEVIRAAKNRLLDESAEAGVIDELVNSIYSAGSGVNIAEKVKIWTAKTYAKGIKAFSKPYQSTDAIFKISQWQQEVKTQEYIYGADKTQEEKEDAATDLVRSEQPTYSQQASIFKALSKNIFLSTFISFDVQTWRNRYNIIANSARFRKEAMENTTLAEQYKSKGDNANYEKHKLRAKKLNNQAKRRVVGFFLTAVLLKGAAEYSKYLFNISDDDEENLAIASGSDYNKYNAKIFTSGDLRKNQHYDMAFVDPWSNFWRPITAASRGDDTLDGILNAAGEVVDPYLAKEVLWTKVQEAIAGFNSKGEEITNEQMSPYHRISRPLFHALSALEPGIWRDGKAITDDLLFNDPTDHKGSTKKAGVVFWNAMLGVKEKETDVIRSYSFKRFHEHNAVDKILQNHKDGVETGSDTKAYLDGAWGVMKKEYDAMIGLGFSRSEIMKSYGYTDSEGKKHEPNSTKVKMLTEVANGRKWKLNEEKSTLILPKKGRSYFTKEEMGISNSQLGIPNIKNQIKIK